MHAYAHSDKSAHNKHSAHKDGYISAPEGVMHAQYWSNEDSDSVPFRENEDSDSVPFRENEDSDSVPFRENEDSDSVPFRERIQNGQNDADSRNGTFARKHNDAGREGMDESSLNLRKGSDAQTIGKRRPMSAGYAQSSGIREAENSNMFVNGLRVQAFRPMSADARQRGVRNRAFVRDGVKNHDVHIDDDFDEGCVPPGDGGKRQGDGGRRRNSRALDDDIQMIDGEHQIRKIAPNRGRVAAAETQNPDSDDQPDVTAAPRSSADAARARDVIIGTASHNECNTSQFSSVSVLNEWRRKRASKPSTHHDEVHANDDQTTISGISMSSGVWGGSEVSSIDSDLDNISLGSVTQTRTVYDEVRRARKGVREDDSYRDSDQGTHIASGTNTTRAAHRKLVHNNVSSVSLSGGDYTSDDYNTNDAVCRVRGDAVAVSMLGRLGDGKRGAELDEHLAEAEDILERYVCVYVCMCRPGRGARIAA